LEQILAVSAIDFAMHPLLCLPVLELFSFDWLEGVGNV
jgi:hypothetical protein